MATEIRDDLPFESSERRDDAEAKQKLTAETGILSDLRQLLRLEQQRKATTTQLLLPSLDLETGSSDSTGKPAVAGSGRTSAVGDREILVQESGSAEYTIEKGDTLRDVARDVLKHEHSGHNPTAKEIGEEVNRIARENGNKDITRVEPGDRFHISKPDVHAGHPVHHSDHAHDNHNKPTERSQHKAQADAQLDEKQAGDVHDKKVDVPATPGEKPQEAKLTEDQRKQMDKVVEALHTAAGQDHFYSRFHGDEVKALLKDRSEAERQYISGKYKERYKGEPDLDSVVSKHMQPSDRREPSSNLLEYMNLMYRNDNDKASEDLRHIDRCLTESWELNGRT